MFLTSPFYFSPCPLQPSSEKLRWALERHGWRYHERAYPYGFHIFPILDLSPPPPAVQRHTAPLLIVPSEASDSGKDEVR